MGYENCSGNQSGGCAEESCSSKEKGCKSVYHSKESRRCSQSSSTRMERTQEENLPPPLPCIWQQEPGPVQIIVQEQHLKMYAPRIQLHSTVEAVPDAT